MRFYLFFLLLPDVHLHQILLIHQILELRNLELVFGGIGMLFSWDGPIFIASPDIFREL